jgi:diaminopimelate epimerase
LISSLRDGNHSPVDVRTKGGEVLRVYFRREKDRFFDIWLEGDTNIVYKGTLHEEALL